MIKLYSLYVLGVVCLIFFISGIRQYLNPEKTVQKRYTKHHKLAVETKDKEFQLWLDKEFAFQVKKTKKIGLILASLEGIFLLIVVFLLVNFKR